jgi:predicted RND superfamily exporter protein
VLCLSTLMASLSFVPRLTAASFRHPRRFLLGALVVLIAGAALASRLEIRSSFEDLLPPDLPSVRHAKDLARRVGGDGTVLVVVESLPGPANLEQAKGMASRLAEDYRALGPSVIRSVEVNLGEVERWFADHWPLFLDLAELEESRGRMVQAIGRAKARANPVMNFLDAEEEEDTGPIRIVDPLLDPGQPLPRALVAQRFARHPEGFLVHPDGRSVLVVVRPTGTSLGVGEARKLLDRMRSVTDLRRAELDAANLRVGFAGTFPILLSEYEAIVGDIFSTFGMVLALVLLSILLFFRAWRPVLALGFAILVAVAATFGLTWLAIGYLNTQTAFLGSIVAGNGINYGLVYLARVAQLRRRDVPLEAACLDGAGTAARATLLASMATSVAFGTLLIASNRGFRDFGLIGGVGMLLCWIATFALLPALLVSFERIRPERHRPERPSSGRGLAFLGRLFARPRLIILVCGMMTAASVALFAWRLPDAMERNLENLTNEASRDTILKRDNDRANAALGQSIAGALALLPSRDAAEEYCRVVRARTREQPRLSALIEGCETVSTAVPSQQAEKLLVLADIRERITDGLLRRLPPDQAERARSIRADLAMQKPISVEDAPPTLIDRFREKDGEVGRLAFIRARPQARLELGPNLRDFVAGIRDVPVGDLRVDAAGEQVVIADLLANVESEGPRTTLLSFLGVCLLVVLFFGWGARGAVVLLALTVGVALMAGVATVAGIRINFFNFLVYPITFGIAVDYGANVVARIDDRRTVLPALLEVGPAVVLCSWTTIVGYGSLIFSINRALQSFGWYAMLGEFTTLLAALILIPAVDLAFQGRGISPGPAGRGGAGESPRSGQEDWHAE